MGTGRLDQGWLRLFNEGSALIAGLVTASGEPRGTFAWGAIVEPDGLTVRVLLPAAEVAALDRTGDDGTGWTIALNCTDVRTLRSLQLKGPVTEVGPIDDADRSTRDGYCQRYFDAVQDVDLISRTLMERMVADDLVACTFTIADAFDQTPGPGAGQPIDRDAS